MPAQRRGDVAAQVAEFRRQNGNPLWGAIAIEGSKFQPVVNSKVMLKGDRLPKKRQRREQKMAKYLADLDACPMTARGSSYNVQTAVEVAHGISVTYAVTIDAPKPAVAVDGRCSEVCP
ncbi:MAG: hypothetical protein ACLGHG_06875 [Gammaproteobacteria bacterium]